MNERASAARLEFACRDSGLSVAELWLRYFGLGGGATPAEVRVYVHGDLAPDPAEYDVVVHAINERYMELERPERSPHATGANRGQHRAQPGTKASRGGKLEQGTPMT